jgi:hypothetical protein
MFTLPPMPLTALNPDALILPKKVSPPENMLTFPPVALVPCPELRPDVSILPVETNQPAGNLFISSGFSGGGAVNAGLLDTSSGSAVAGSAGRIYLGANVAGTNGTSPFGNADIDFTIGNAFSQSTTPDPFLFYNGSPSSITTNTTLTVTPTSVNIYPGVYTTDIGSSGTPVTITLDLGGDSRTIVPIMSLGDIYLSGFSGDNTVGGSLQYQKNGYGVYLTSGGNTGIVLSGNITSAPQSGGTTGAVSLVNLGPGGITQSAGSIAASTLTMLSGGSIGSFANQIQTSSTNLRLASFDNVYVNAAGAATVLNGVSGLNSVMQVTANGALTANSMIAGGIVSLATTGSNGAITLNQSAVGFNGVSLFTDGTGNLTTSASMVASFNGAINMTVNNLTLNGVVMAGSGTVTIQPNGDKSIGVNGATGTLTLSATALSRISANTLVVGNFENQGNLTVLGSLNVSGVAAGQYYNLVFNNEGNYSASGQTITLGTRNLQVNAVGTVNTGSVISTGGSVTHYGGSGVTVSGALTTGGGALTLISGGNISTASGAGAINSSSALGAGGNITMVAGAHTLVFGTTLQVIDGVPAGGNINLSSGTAITSFNSQTSKSGFAGGQITLIAYGGSGTGAITLPTGVGVTASGNGTGINGNVTAIAGATTGTGITLGSITSNAGTGGGGVVTLANAQPTISGGGVCSPCVSFANGNQNAGSFGFASGLAGAGMSLSSITSSTSIGITAGANLTLPSAITAGTTVSVSTAPSSNASITVNANLTGATGVTLTTDGTGDVANAVSTSISTTNAPISITANNVSFAGSVNAGTSTVALVPNGAKSIAVGGSGATFNVTSANLNAITASTLTIGSTGVAGGMTIAGAVNVSGSGAGAFNLALNNGGNYTGAGQTITLGSKTLNVSAVGTVNTGNVAGVDAVVTMQGTAGLTVSGTGVQLTGTSSSASLTAGGSSTLAVNNGANVSSNATTLAGTSITNDGTVASTGTTLTVNTAALTNNGQMNVTGALNISNTGAGNLIVSQTGSGQLSAGVSGTITLTSSNGAVGVTQSNIVGTVAGTSASSFNVTTTGSGITLGTITTNQSGAAPDGSITVNAGTGVLKLASGATLTAEEGNITLNNADTTNGTILLDQGSTINAFSTSESVAGQVNIVIGGIPGSPSNPYPGTQVSGITVNQLGGAGSVYFGPQLVSANGSNVINVQPGTVINSGEPTVKSSLVKITPGVILNAETPIPGIFDGVIVNVPVAPPGCQTKVPPKRPIPW